MKLLIKNVEYFEWEVPDEITKNIKIIDQQDLVDEYFDPQNLSVYERGDPYYEMVEEL